MYESGIAIPHPWFMGTESWVLITQDLVSLSLIAWLKTWPCTRCYLIVFFSLPQSCILTRDASSTTYILGLSERVIVVNINWEMFQLYHGKIKLHFEEMMFALYHHIQLDFHRASSLIDISLHSDTLFGFRANQSLFLLSSKYQFYSLWFYLTKDRTHILHLKRAR